MVTDTLSPHLAHFSFSFSYPFLVPASNSALRVVALCLSGAFRALCGAVAGGSKAALTVHFATAGERPGDVGDLSAKDGSKETVLALLGMLVSRRRALSYTGVADKGPAVRKCRPQIRTHCARDLRRPLRPYILSPRGQLHRRARYRHACLQPATG